MESPSIFFEVSTLPLEFATTIKPNYLAIRRASQAGMDYLVVFENFDMAIRLPVEFENDCMENEDITESCFIEAGTHDFDADGLPEIIVAVGDGSVNLQVNIFSYHPPANAVDANRTENFKLIGNFSWQSEAIIKNQSIIFPFGSQGLEQKMTFIDGVFVEVNH